MMKTAALLCLSLLAAVPARADEIATKEDTIDFVRTAVVYLKKHGPEKTWREFMNTRGPFIYKNLYISANDLSGRCLAHGADPSRVGKNFLDAADPDGKPFMRERFEAAKAKGSGWQTYKFRNPSTGKIESKSTYFELVGDVVIAAGAY